MFVIIHELFNVISDNVDILGTVGMLDHPSIVVEHWSRNTGYNLYYNVE